MKKRLQHRPFTGQISHRLFLLIALAFTLGINAQITSFPWTETFNSESPTRDSWTQIYELNNMSWTYTNDATTGSYNLDPYDGDFANFPGTSHDFDTTKLVSPVLNLSGMANVTLNFVYVNPFWSPDQNWLTIYYRTSATDPWVQLQEYHSDVTTWTPSGNISLPNPSATYQIAIECKTDYGYSTLVDQVVIDGTSAVPVTDVDVATQGGVPATITTTGGTLALVATVNPSGANQSVTWLVTSGSAFGTVNASGVVTANASGTVTVRATSVGDPTKFDEITITITLPAVTDVDVTTQGNVPATISTAGGTLPLVAVVNPSGASQSVTWSVVSGAASGSVSASGVVTAITSGTVTVRATSVADPTKFDEIVVTINLPIAVTGVDVTTQGNVPASITTAGGTLQLVATVNPAGANQNVIWTVVSGSSFGSVNTSGVVTGLANGTVTVRATSVADTTKFDDIVITVNAPIAVADVVISTQGNVPAEITTAGGTLQLVAVVNPSGANQNVTWSVVAGGGFASVSASGVVTAIADGIVTIQATSVADPTKTDIIDVVINTVIPVTGVVITTEGNVPAEITTVGGTLQLEATVNPSGASQEVTWSVVAGGAFASVSASGVVTAIADGIVTIQATSVADPTKTDIIDVVINTIIPIESVEAGTEGNVPATITTAGGTLQLEATVNPSGADQEVTWSIVSGSEFATLGADGLVTATADGTIVIRVTSVSDPTKFDDITITISGNLGTGDFSINSIKAYPNPVADVLHITAKDAIKTVEIYNMLGQQMAAKAVSGDQGQIDMASFASGNYILKINTENASKTMKIVKQ